MAVISHRYLASQKIARVTEVGPIELMSYFQRDATRSRQAGHLRFDGHMEWLYAGDQSHDSQCPFTRTDGDLAGRVISMAMAKLRGKLANS